MGMDTDEATRRLRAASLRVTASRLGVLATLGADAHLPVDVIVRGARERLGSLSVQAVYDILDVFLAAGIVRRIEPAGSPARFELRVGDNHHHLVCRSCGTVRDVDCVIGTAPCLEPADDHGFAVDEAEVTFWGVCAACRADPGRAAAPGTESAPGTGGRATFRSRRPAGPDLEEAARD
jgi:Fur family transcriptional regulator, stress-responsive regulator